MPEILRAGYFRLGDRDFSPDYLGAFHAIHLHEYHCQMRLAGQIVDIAPGDVTVSPAGQATAYHLRAPGQHWCIHFLPQPAQSAADPTQFLTIPLHLRFDAPGVVRENMANICRIFAASCELGSVVAALALQQMLVWLVTRGRYGPDVPAVVIRASAIIDEHFHEQLGVGDIARKVGVSQPHLARCFKAHYGATIAHRLNDRRMQHARFLLEFTDLPIWRIAERCGIPDPQHFNKRIRQWWGTSPSGLRQATPAKLLVDPDR